MLMQPPLPSQYSPRARECGRLPRANAHYNQADAGNQRQGAQDWRDRQGLLLLMGNLEGSEVDILFLMSKTKTPGNKTYDCNNNQNDSHDCGGFHRQLAFIECYLFAADGSGLHLQRDAACQLGCQIMGIATQYSVLFPGSALIDLQAAGFQTL